MEEEKGSLPFQIVEQSWDKKAKVWNLVYTLDFQSVPKGEYILDVRFFNQQKDTKSEKNISLKII
jgi:hypothetical protein